MLYIIINNHRFSNNQKKKLKNQVLPQFFIAFDIFDS